MRTNNWHVDNAKDDEILAEYDRIKNKISKLGSRVRHLVSVRAEKILKK